MDNHPIPQDVTGFQFKLIGNMTIKQFAYLAGGVVFAWIFYQLPMNFLIKFPLSAFSAIFGIGLAYLPVSGRPMDLMIGNFIKALIRPTQFVYEKTGGQLYFPHRAILTTTAQHYTGPSIFPKDKLKLYLDSLDNKPKNKVDEKENNFLASVSSLSLNNYAQTPPQPVIVAQQINEPQPLDRQPAPPPAPAPQHALSAPDSPNLIIGTTKDPRGNTLPNILVEIKDKDNNPIRAFKTNELGRFASATPLLNGAYVMEFEDPKGQNKFEKVTINASGQIIQPINAVSVDTREELRRSLFSAG